MSQMPKHIKIKRAQKKVLVKRSRFVKNYPETKSYKPLCKKLQNNNTVLAKALSKQKEESQLLFSQNVALITEVQDLGLACNKRDAVISNILKNAKEMLKMLVSITGYLTNTISSCQQYAESTNSNIRLSCHSTRRKEPHRRLSVKSPAKGVVKPMVSGCTITKPTINLSRINMQHINNSSNLSVIPEIATPPRDEELNNSTRTSNAISLQQRRAETGRTCRMPERLTALQRESDENDQRMSERRSNRHSRRMSGRLSKSKCRLSKNSSLRYSIENFEYIGSPRVKLNDVSKLLQNSQSINIRMLTKNQNIEVNNSLENNDGNPREHSQVGVIPETPPSDGFNNDTDKSIENKMEQSNNDMDTMDHTEKEDINETNDRSSSSEDPLEGPSWLFNTSQDAALFMNKDKKTDDLNVSNADITSKTMKATEHNNTLKTGKSASQISPQPTSSKRRDCTKSYKNISQIEDKNEFSMFERSKDHDSFLNMSATAVSPKLHGNQYTVEPLPPTMNFANFVTNRRGCFESEDEDDFTLMFARHPRNMHFDINDLKLPVLEQSALKPVIPVELEPEITTTLRKISQIGSVPSVSNNSLDETLFNPTTVNLPLLLNNDYNSKDLMTPEKKTENLQPKKKNKMSLRKSNNIVTVTSPNSKKSSKKKGKDKVAKDPSAVKVVLQKLNESNVNSRTPSPDETTSRDSNIFLSSISSRADNSSDSECNSNSNDIQTVSRPRRKRATISLQEPNLRKKLRRNR